MRGLTTHCRRDPQNPKGDKTNRSGTPFCMGAREVGTEWPVRRLAGCCPLGLGGVESLVQQPAQRPGHKKIHATRTPQETSAHALHHILSSDTCTPHTRATARRNSSDALSTYGTYTHCVSRVPVHAVSQPSPSNLCHSTLCSPFSSSVRPLLVVYLHLFNMYTYGTQVSSSSVSGGLSGPRDVLWERALASLPEPLLRALLDADLGNASTLQNYPRMDGHVLEEMFDWGGAGVVGTASSDAASTGSSSSTYGHGVQARVPEWCVSDVGGDPRTGQASSHKGDDPKTVHFVPETGGDPKTDHEALHSDRGVDPKTDHASLVFVGETETRAATCPPYRPGRLATANCEFLCFCFPCFACYGCTS